MKNFLLRLPLLGLIFIGFSASAQITADTEIKIDSNKVWNVHGQNALFFSQSAFSNWAGGGINTIAGNALLNYDFNYRKNNWSWDNKAIFAYGVAFQKGLGTRKNDDRIILNSLLGYKASKYWMYTLNLNFTTQFTKGYDYKESTKGNLISDLFAPAFLTFGPGFAYKRSNNFFVNISPAALRFTFVGNKILSDRGAFGVDSGKSIRTEFGASLNAYYKANLTKNLSMENILKLYSNYLEDPQNVDIDYTLNFLLSISKYITLNAGLQLVYDDNTTFEKRTVTNAGGSEVKVFSPALQVREVLGLGVTYRF